MTKEDILEAMPPYPSELTPKGSDLERGYHMAVDNLIKVLDKLEGN
jgi:hypothetical protein